MFLLYSLLYTAAISLLFIPEYLKRPKTLRKKWLLEKFGFLPRKDSSLWVHAVSVGEVHSSLRLLKNLRSAYPDIPLVLSTITDTGQQVAREKAPEGVTVIYLPFDLSLVLKRAIRLIRPKIFIVIETELWPNIFRIMNNKGVPVLVLNGRISAKSARGYRMILFFMKKVLSYISAFGMQSQQDAHRLQQIGAAENKIKIIGNFKFDMNLPLTIPEWLEKVTGPVIVAGSTHRGEEEIILEAFRNNLAIFPELSLIIAPRHPERFLEVETYLNKTGLPFVKRSDITGCSTIRGVILLDTVGELSSVYSIADIAVMGKSFTGRGGQNPLEPAYWGKAIICGPHMENFPFINHFIAAGAAFEVDSADLAKKIRELLITPDKAKNAGAIARELLINNSGAVDRAFALLKQYIV